jgi:hypothetical protein
MNDAHLATLAEIRGFFRAFEWVNNKCDNGYCFQLSLAPRNSDIQAAVASHFSDENPTHLSVTHVDDWRELLTKTLIRWLLAYLNDDPVSGRLRLVDEHKNFSLSLPCFYNRMVELLIEQIESLSPIQSAHTIRGLDAWDYSEIILVASDHLVILHFEVFD